MAFISAMSVRLQSFCSRSVWLCIVAAFVQHCWRAFSCTTRWLTRAFVAQLSVSSSHQLLRRPAARRARWRGGGSPPPMTTFVLYKPDRCRLKAALPAAFRGSALMQPGCS